MKKEDNEALKKGCFLSFSWITFLIVGIVIGFFICKCSRRGNNSLPVEEIIKIDSVVKVNNDIKVKIKHLNDEKETRVKEVSNLDNDSTLKLFYELVSE